MSYISIKLLRVWSNTGQKSPDLPLQRTGCHHSSATRVKGSQSSVPEPSRAALEASGIQSGSKQRGPKSVPPKFFLSQSFLALSETLKNHKEMTCYHPRNCPGFLSKEHTSPASCFSALRGHEQKTLPLPPLPRGRWVEKFPWQPLIHLLEFLVTPLFSEDMSQRQQESWQSCQVLRVWNENLVST